MYKRQIQDILALEGCEVLISGANCSYLYQCDDSFVARMRDGTGNHVRVVHSLEEIEEDIIKISAYCPAGAAVPEKALGGKWPGIFRMAVAGAEWLDFTLADKGIGLRQLCGALGIPLENTLAFGDNWNDLPMLEAVSYTHLCNGIQTPAPGSTCPRPPHSACPPPCLLYTSRCV